MRKHRAYRLLAVLLAVLLLSQTAAFQTAAYAEDGAVPVLKNGTAVIPYGADSATVKDILCSALVANADQVDAQSLKWEYECEGQASFLWGNKTFGSIEGFESTNKVGLIPTTYKHPALWKNSDGVYQIRLKGRTDSVTLTKAAKYASSITLNPGAAVNLVYNDDLTVDYNNLRQQIWENAVAATEPELTLADVTIEYYATAISGSLGSLGQAYVPLEGGSVSGLNYPAMTEGTRKIRVSYSGDDTHFSASAETELTVLGRPAVCFALKEGPYQVDMVFNDDLSYNYAAVEQSIFNAVVESTEPSLTFEDLSIQYNAAYVGENYQSLSYTSATTKAFGPGEWSIRISWDGNMEYAGGSVTVPVSCVDSRTAGSISFVESPSVKLVYNDDLTVDYDALRRAVWENVVSQTTPDTLTLDDVIIEYYATAVTGSAGSLGKSYAPLQGGTVGGLNYPAIAEGAQTLRVSYAGDVSHTGFSGEVSVNILGRPEVAFILKPTEGPYSVGAVFNDDLSYNYPAIEQAIFDAVVLSSEPELTLRQVKIEYNADPTGIVNVWQPLDKGGLNAFDMGTWDIRFSWSGTTEYKDGSFTVKVTLSDNRIASEIIYAEGAAITYNMDANVMKQALFDTAIDWTNSTLPEKSRLSIEDFTFEYYGENVLNDNINGGVSQWAPVEGGTVNLLTYPQMGAGENQQLRISYTGNAEYRPVKNAEGTVTVNKATVKVSVHSTNIYVDESLPAGFITTDPADKFDIYTIYAGLTNNVTSYIYLQLPARFTNETVLKVLDPVVKSIYGKTLSQIMQDGMTVGELRQLLSAQELLDLLDKLNIDTGTFGQIVSVLNKLPGIFDNVRVAFGTPKDAGLYTVYAITDNKNYETGVGTGMLLIKARMIGVKLEWNESIRKLSAAEAAAADFGATVTYNGEAVADQSNVHYLYTGITSSLKPYTSTTTPPTEPGRYTMTVVTLGGNYQALPVTRSFQITK